MAIAAKFRTQLAFARALPMHPVSLNKICNGWNEPTPLERQRIAEALGADADWLFSSISRIPSPRNCSADAAGQVR
jgi:transcriptional regulator with XRE-family HTH domain